MKKIMIILGLLLTTNAAMADYTAQPKIVRIYAYQDYAIVYVKNKVSTVCKGKNHLKIVDIRNKGKAMYAAALSAKQGGNPVNLGYVKNKCSTWGSNTLPAVYSVIVK